MSTHFKEDYITDTESGSSEEASGSEEDVASWISWFCSLKGNEFFCEIEEDYIQDDFNLSGLCSQASPIRACVALQNLFASHRVMLIKSLLQIHELTILMSRQHSGHHNWIFDCKCLQSYYVANNYSTQSLGIPFCSALQASARQEPQESLSGMPCGLLQGYNHPACLADN